MPKKSDKDFDAPEPVLEEVSKIEAPVEVPNEAPEIPASEPECTVRAFLPNHRSDPIARAFVSCEEREHGVRKLTLHAWVKLFEDFKAAER